MFSCKKCQAYQDEIKHLREQNKSLVDRLIALSSTSAYQLITSPVPEANNYYGNGADEMVEYDVFGQPITVKNGH